MTARTNQDVAHAAHAELTGLVPQLTTPSRHHGELVDIWFGVRWTERQPEWDDSFERLANGRRPDPDHPSFFSLFSHAPSSGLIVARHVTPDRQVWRNVEETARALIDQVNRDVAARREPPSRPASTGRGWSLRMRDASSFLFSLSWFGEPKPALPSVSELPMQISQQSSGHIR